MTQKKQIRIGLTVTEEEQLAIKRAYASYLETADRYVSMNNWLKEMIFDKVRR